MRRLSTESIVGACSKVVVLGELRIVGESNVLWHGRREYPCNCIVYANSTLAPNPGSIRLKLGFIMSAVRGFVRWPLIDRGTATCGSISLSGVG